MKKPVPETTESNNREIFLDFLKEVTGYEHGLGRTIIDLRKKPDVVLQSYLTRQGHYVSPFRLLFTALGLWIFVNSFIIDWYAVWYDMSKQFSDFLTDYVYHVPLERKIKNAQELDKVMRIYSTFAGDLFSKYYVPFVVLTLPLSSWLATKFCRPYKLPFRSILISNTYSVAANTYVGFFMSVGFALNAFVTAAIVTILLVLVFTGRNFIQLTPLRNFYSENGAAIEKRILGSNVLAVCFLMTLMVLSYFLMG